MPLILGSGIEEANLDFEEERSEGKAVAMPQLISVLVAILFGICFSSENGWVDVAREQKARSTHK